MWFGWNKSGGPARGQIGNGRSADDGTIESVTLEWNAAGGADQALEFCTRSELLGGGAGVVINFFFDDGAVNIVCAESQCDLRDARSEHDPIRFDVIKIIQQQARDGDGAKIVEAGGFGQIRQRGIFRMKRQRNKCLEAVGVVLQFAQKQQMLDALFFIFNVAVEHGGV